jgi:predicted TIM-barrel fold metal-dependent hydrolase
MVNPHFMDASLEAMDRCFGQWGFVQLGELVTYLMNYDMNSSIAERVVRKAREYDVPVHVHISTSNAHPQGHFASGEEELTDLMDLMERVPEARYIMAHGVGAPLIEPPVIDTYLAMVEQRFGSWPENLWIEIMHFHAAGVRSALERIPGTRILAGMDWAVSGTPPYPPYGTVFGPAEDEQPYPPCVASLAAFLEDAGADADTVNRIAHVNAEELYALESGR